LRSLFSVSSPVAVLPSNSTLLPGESQRLQTLNLISENQRFQVTFNESGLLTLVDTEAQETIWQSSPAGNILILDEVANLNIYASGDSSTPVFSLPSFLSGSGNLFGTLWISNSGTFSLTDFQGETVWYINNVVPVAPSTLPSPYSFTQPIAGEPHILLLATSGSRSFALQFSSDGILRVIQFQSNVIIACTTCWQQDTIPNETAQPPFTVSFSNAGNLTVTDSVGQTIWASNTANFYDPEPPYTLSLDTTGKLAIAAATNYNVPSAQLWCQTSSASSCTTVNAVYSTSSDAFLVPSPNVSLNWYLSNPGRDLTVYLNQIS
jgi:hypothetical protein